MARISVIGTGYLGLTHAVCMASLGHEVIALDVDREKLNQLISGITPFHEPELDDLLRQVLDQNLISFTDSFKSVAEFADFHFICVGTPQKINSNEADLSQINHAIESFAPFLDKPSIIIGKSTVPVGTARKVEQFLQSNSPAKSQVRLVWNPEFLREGFAVQDTLNPDRLVFGSNDENDSKAVLDLFNDKKELEIPVIFTNFETAELVKVAANSFLATKISFINSFARLSSAVGADISVLADAIGYDERIGRKFLNAGIGFGGGCLPKDIRALYARASELGFSQEFAFLPLVDEINKLRRAEVVDIIKNEFKDLTGLRVAVLGASFKPNSDDIRDSPSIEIANKLFELGAKVSIFDPEANENVSKLHKNLKTANSVDECVTEAEVTLHLTEWVQFRQLDLHRISKLVSNKRIIDGRNILSRELWENAGWQITYLGKPGS